MFLILPKCDEESHFVKQPASSDVPPRVKKACDRCRMKKIKCNGKFPCSRCCTEKIQCLQSTHPTTDMKAISRSYIAELEKRQSQLVEALHELMSLPGAHNHEVGEVLDKLKANGLDLIHEREGYYQPSGRTTSQMDSGASSAQQTARTSQSDLGRTLNSPNAVEMSVNAPSTQPSYPEGEGVGIDGDVFSALTQSTLASDVYSSNPFKSTLPPQNVNADPTSFSWDSLDVGSGMHIGMIDQCFADAWWDDMFDTTDQYDVHGGNTQGC